MLVYTLIHIIIKFFKELSVLISDSSISIGEKNLNVSQFSSDMDLDTSESDHSTTEDDSKLLQGFPVYSSNLFKKVRKMYIEENQ